MHVSLFSLPSPYSSTSPPPTNSKQEHRPLHTERGSIRVPLLETTAHPLPRAIRAEILAFSSRQRYSTLAPHTAIQPAFIFEHSPGTQLRKDIREMGRDAKTLWARLIEDLIKPQPLQDDATPTALLLEQLGSFSSELTVCDESAVERQRARAQENRKQVATDSPSPRWRMQTLRRSGEYSRAVGRNGTPGGCGTRVRDPRVKELGDSPLLLVVPSIGAMRRNRLRVLFTKPRSSVYRFGQAVRSWNGDGDGEGWVRRASGKVMLPNPVGDDERNPKLVGSTPDYAKSIVRDGRGWEANEGGVMRETSRTMGHAALEVERGSAQRKWMTSELCHVEASTPKESQQGGGGRKEKKPARYLWHFALASHYASTHFTERNPRGVLNSINLHPVLASFEDLGYPLLDIEGLVALGRKVLVRLEPKPSFDPFDRLSVFLVFPISTNAAMKRESVDLVALEVIW
ncbi:hypothetical protein C8R44DRAFT_745668 [Mycena epipterygia]|nr:hypothetical protein C8R44DRAFT_745668 [Mycena epipterygia]